MAREYIRKSYEVCYVSKIVKISKIFLVKLADRNS